MSEDDRDEVRFRVSAAMGAELRGYAADAKIGFGQFCRMALIVGARTLGRHLSVVYVTPTDVAKSGEVESD